MPNNNRYAFRNRLDFSKIPTTIQIPNLIEVQKRSYDRFLQMDMLPSERDDGGLQAVFQSVFPISDFRNVSQLEFVDYAIGNWECKCGHLKGLHHLRTTCRNCGSTVITDPYHTGDVLCQKCGTYNANTPDFCNKCGDPVGLQLKYDQKECEERGMTYSAPLKVTMRLTIYEKDPETEARTIRDIKEQEVFFGDIPLMTDNGTFIINGTERVIVSQLHRSPGVFFESANSRTYFLGKIIPYRGSWVEFEYDQKNILYVRIDRKRKFLGTIFLRALGLRSDEEILRTFYTVDRIALRDSKLYWTLEPGIERPTNLVGMKLVHAVKSRGGEEIVHSGRKVTNAALKEIQKARISELEIDTTDLEGAFTAADIVDTNTGEVMLEANSEITPDKLSKIMDAGVTELHVFFPERDDVGTVVSATLRRDSVKTPQEALIEIYRKLRPGDPPTLDTATSLFHGMFFDPRKYDFSRVGRLKFNIKLFENAEATKLENRTLDPDDFYATIRYLLKLRKNIGTVDDIDHLGNRRVRAVGELMENQFRIGLVRMERAIKEKMSVYQEMSTAMPHDLVNAKPVMAAIREFFGSSQLSQFMDQTNPLSEITHKRRLSALGPGGLSRERAGFEVRDVHPTHYGRICPIETPEGPNIGLISSLSCYARINDYGFIESPYRKVKGAKVQDFVTVVNAGDSDYRVGDHIEKAEVLKANEDLHERRKKAIEWEPFSFYLSAWEEDRHVIAQANVELDDKGRIINDLVNARKAGNFVLVPKEEVDYIDVSPKQLVSVAASLVPFLEHDDANRALMGANMQRQSVPLLRAEAPIVGTGMEGVTARDSGAVILARRSGIVDSVDSERIIVRVEGEHHGQLSREVGSDIYQLTKFKRSNQNTCINQKPVVKKGDRVGKGQVIADGPCTDKGELALGRNVLVAFMPWRGYNFEDAILVSEKLVKEDYYTSVHIEEFEIESRDTKLGPEEITRDIPNVSESALRDLDESGIIRIGATVKAGDILVGKVTPKGETQLTPEEKLLRAIFGEKAGDVRDASLTCPPGIEGTVVDVKIFSRKGQEKDERAKAIEAEEIQQIERNLGDEIRILTDERLKRLEGLLGNKEVLADLHDEKTNKKLLAKGALLDRDTIERISTRNLKRIKYPDKDPRVNEQIDEIEEMTSRQIDVLRKIAKEREEKLKKGDELPPGVIKLVKVYIAMKRKLSVGDKMAGRHGNKGVIARILPEEDMPYLEDGTPVEIVLNPLGVPSRMNVGQILETHLGWAGKELGKRVSELVQGNGKADHVRRELKSLFKGLPFLDTLTDLDDQILERAADVMQEGVYFASPVFDGSKEPEIKQMLREAGLPESGKADLYDGMTGEKFEQPVTVGYIYMLKLSHLVDDKIHARSIGPYSLITQQPLGGKAQFGGQRFGEMEVWALEAYGAAYILQELLTAKSDDVYGRTKIYEAIVKGEAAIEPGVPESFNVLIRELQSLCLDVELIKTAERKPTQAVGAAAD
jgi:DNA-directed RNA polymerase subunit beta